jgi:hypothetical protein
MLLPTLARSFLRHLLYWEGAPNGLKIPALRQTILSLQATPAACSALCTAPTTVMRALPGSPGSSSATTPSPGYMSSESMPKRGPVFNIGRDAKRRMSLADKDHAVSAAQSI